MGCKVDGFSGLVDKLLLVFLLFPACFAPVRAQALLEDGYTTEILDVEDGLPYTNVDGLFQDDKGFMWISMFGGGLARYDGSSFVWLHSKSSPASLRSNVVTESCQDRFDRQWVSTAQGIDVIDMRTLTLVDMPESVTLTHDGKYCNFIASDAKGCIWYTTGNNIYRVSFDSEGSVSQVDSLCCSETESEIRLDFKDVDEDGSVWTSIDGKLYKIFYVSSKKRLEMTRLFPGLSLGDGVKVSAFLKKDNTIWIGSNDGLFKLDLIGGTMVRYKHSASDPRSLSHDEVTGLAMVDEGDVFVSTLNGVNIYSPIDDGFVSIYSEVNKFGARLLSGNLIRSMVAVGNQIWLGTELNGISILNRKRLPITNVTHRENDMTSLPISPVSAVCFDDMGRLWNGSIEHGLFLHDGDYNFRNYSSKNSSLAHNSVIAIAGDAHGKMWLGTMKGNLQVTDMRNPGVFTRPSGSDSEIASRIDNINGLAYDALNDCMWICSRTGLFRYNIKESRYEAFDEDLSLCFVAKQDNYGRLWVGHQGGVTCIDLKSGSHTTYSEPSFGFFLDIDVYDNLWIGSFDGGLYKVSVAPTTKMEFTHYSVEDGLCDDRIRGVIADGDYLWLSTENGLSRLGIVSGRIESFSVSDGLASMAFYNNAVVKSPSGSIYLGHKSGLSILWSSYVKPSSVENARLSFINGIFSDQRVNLTYEKSFKIHERDKGFAFQFADFAYGSDAEIKYFCKIEPLDDEWREIQNERNFVRYGIVPGGHYNLRIIAQDSSGTIVSEDSRELRVVPYFWKTWWFAAIVLLLALLAVYEYVSIRTKAIERKRKMLQKEVDRQTKLLSEQKQQLQMKADELAEQNKILLKQNEEMAGRTIVFSTGSMSGHAAKDTMFVEEVMAKIRDLYKNPDLDINGLSESMGMSRSVLNGKLQDAFGQSIGQFIRTYRLNVAREIICSGKVGGMNVSEIAYEVGFNDPKYFTRCFSKAFGMAPSQMMNGDYVLPMTTAGVAPQESDDE